MLAGQEQVQEHAKSINISHRCDRVTGNLLGGREQRRKASATFERQLSGRRVSFFREQFGDAEVEQFHISVGSDHYIGRFDVAMHDQIGVSMRDSIQDVEKQANTGVDVEPVVIAITVHRLALAIFEDEVSLPLGGNAGVDHLRDVGMRKTSEDVSLTPEAFGAGLRHGEIQKFNSDAALETAIASFGQPHCSHSAVADRRNKRVRPNSLTGESGLPAHNQRVFQKVLVCSGNLLV